MATRQEIESTYNYMDQIVRSSLGKTPDFSCAMYDGDYSKSLLQAQRDKHEYILRSIGFQPSWRVLDIGCGWGPVLRAVEENGGRAIGITLSTKQLKACRRQNLEAHLMDWRDLSVDTFGKFDAVVSVGAFEHFCSTDEYLKGQQEDIYRNFFELCHELLPPKRRMFLQTMMWGENAPKYEDISLDSDEDSDGYAVAVLSKFYPGSWLPSGVEQIQAAASPYFKSVSLNNGWRDYIETMEQWRKLNDFSHFTGFSMGKAFRALLALRYIAVDKDFRFKLRSIRGGYQRKCFDRHIIDHQRIVLERD